MQVLLSQFDKSTSNVPTGWVTAIRQYYMPYIGQIWTDPEAIRLAMKRERVLYKYWALNDVKTLDEAIATIPLCPICGKELALPSSVEPKTKKGRTWLSVCHNKKCANALYYQRTSETLMETKGIKNISSDPEIKKKKSIKQINNYKDHGDVINAKRANTVMAKYNETNVSKLDFVKKAKSNTFMEHYEVDNVFKIPSERVKNFNALKKYRATDSLITEEKEFTFLSSTEKWFTNFILEYVKPEYVKVNEVLLETSDHSKATFSDVVIGDMFYIELKKWHERFQKKGGTIEDYEIINSFNNIPFFVGYIRDYPQQHMIIINEQTKKRFGYTSHSDDSFISSIFHNLDRSVMNVKDMDKTLIIIMIQKLNDDYLTERGKAFKYIVNDAKTNRYSRKTLKEMKSRYNELS